MTPPGIGDPRPLRHRDPARDRAAHLLSSVDGWADADDALAARRVWRRIGERPLAPGRRRASWWRRAIAASGILVASAAVAGATVGRDFIRVRIDRAFDRAEQPARTAPARPTSAPPPRDRPTAASTVAAPTATEAAVAAPLQTLERRRPSRAPARPSVRKTAPNESPAAVAAPAADEGRLVMEAALALRRQGSPARARELLDKYLTRYPSGVLLEEVLALGMEAAQTPETARAAARRYVERFPRGRFARVAHDTLTAGQSER